MHRYPFAAMLAAGFALAPPVQAAEFTLFVFEARDALARRDGPAEDSARYWQDYADFGASLAQAGIMRGGAALSPDGPVQLDTLALGGYFVIDVASTEQAREWASRAPTNRHGGRVIVVPAVTSPAMAAPSTPSAR